MTKKKKGEPYFPNYHKEIASTHWKDFPTVSFVEFFEHRVWKWKLIKKPKAIMRLEHHNGQVTEWCIHRSQNIDDVIGDVLECDPDCRIFIVTHDKTILVASGPLGDDHVNA